MKKQVQFLLINFFFKTSKTMMKIILLGFFIFFANTLPAQNTKIESLLKALPPAKDTQRIFILNELSSAYLKIKSAETLAFAKSYADEALLLSKSNKFYKGVGAAQYNLGTIILNSNDVKKQAKALQYFQAAIDKISFPDLQTVIMQCRDK